MIGLATKEEIQEIVNTTLETARLKRVGKMFHDPVKAENFGMIIMVIAISSIMINAMVLSGWNEIADKQKQLETTNTILSNALLQHMSCNDLRSELQNYYSGNSVLAQNVHITQIVSQIVNNKC